MSSIGTLKKKIQIYKDLIANTQDEKTRDSLAEKVAELEGFRNAIEGSSSLQQKE
jgi:hypothetical protein